MSELRPAARTTSEAQPTRTRPATSDEAAAVVLKHALGRPDLTAVEALEVHRKRVEALVDPVSDEGLQELSRQLPVLEALWQRLAYDALRERQAHKKALLLRVAIQAQQAHARTFALLRSLALQASSRVEVHLDRDHDGKQG